VRRRGGTSLQEFLKVSASRRLPNTGRHQPSFHEPRWSNDVGRTFRGPKSPWCVALENIAMICEIQGLVILLEHWRRMPDAPPSEFSPFSSHEDRHHRFTGREISRMMDRLRRMSPNSYQSVFPEEGPKGEQGPASRNTTAR